MPNPISPRAARQALEQGIRVQDPLGKELTLDGKILRHWEKAGKSQKDIQTRLSALPLIQMVLRDPAEIWEESNGSRTYLASVLDPYKPKGRTYAVAFTMADDNTTLETYFPNSRSVVGKRRGKQLWPKKPADVSGT